LKSLHAQALKYGARIEHAHAASLITKDGLFILQTDQGLRFSRYLLLATGVRDYLPAIEGAPEAVMRSLLRFCPICDAFEAIDKRIAIVAEANSANGKRSFCGATRLE
jgi:thioredoxin reductase (NADPH)